MKTKLIEWLNERVKECEENAEFRDIHNLRISARVVEGQKEAFNNVLLKIAELDYLESWPQGKGRFEDLTESESENVLQKLKEFEQKLSTLATPDLDEEQKKRLTEIFLKFGNGETGISTEILTEAAQKGCEETPTLLTWQETPEGITATYNGVKIAVIAYSYHCERFHFLYPYPIYDLAEDRVFPRRLWETLEQAQTAMQENFDVFYNKYKPLFEEEKK
jgi:protein subunit release factor A